MEAADCCLGFFLTSYGIIYIYIFFSFFLGRDFVELHEINLGKELG